MAAFGEYMDYSEQPAWATTCGLLSRQCEDKKKHDEEIWDLHQKMWEEGWVSEWEITKFV